MREIISKVQTMRKEAGFEVTDHIRITMEGSEKVTAVAEAKKAEIDRRYAGGEPDRGHPGGLHQGVGPERRKGHAGCREDLNE